MHTYFLSAGGGEGLSLLPNFQKRGALQDLSSQIFGSQRVVAGKKIGGIVFSRGRGGGGRGD